MKQKFLKVLLDRELSGTVKVDPDVVTANIRNIGLSVGESLSDADRITIREKVADFNNSMPVVGEVHTNTSVVSKVLEIPSELKLDDLSNVLTADGAKNKLILSSLGASLGYTLGKDILKLGNISQSCVVEDMSDRLTDEESTEEVVIEEINKEPQEPTKSIDGVEFIKMPDGNTAMSCEGASVAANALANGMKAMVDPLLKNTAVGNLYGGLLERAFARGLAAMKS